MTKEILCLYHIDTTKKVEITSDLSPILENPKSKFIRTSPIFPISDDFITPDEHDNFYIYFIYAQNAFSFLGKLKSNLENNLLNKVCFTVGQANVLFITKDISEIKEIEKFYEGHVLGFELWEISEGELVKSDYKLMERTEPEDLIPIENYSDLENDEVSILNEFKTSIYHIIKLAPIYCKELLPVFIRLIETVNEIILELRFLVRENNNTTTISEERASKILENDYLRIQMIHQRIDQIIQINSQLSYIITQLFSGVMPIVNHPCPIRFHSLLGIGEAVKSVFAISRLAETAFEKYPISELIKKEFKSLPKITIQDSIGKFNPSLWRSRTSEIQLKISELDPKEVNPKLLLFSGRIGFKESLFSVTAALQCLSSADSVRFSLMTLTHELLHGHVRGLIAAIFSGEEKLTSEENFANFYNTYLETVKHNPEEDRLIDSVRAIIFSFISNKAEVSKTIALLEEAEKRNGKQIKQVVVPSSPQLMSKLLKDYYYEISEIMVHVLDFYYFYDGKPEIYLKLLWESWATVPIVIEKLDYYIVRSIITIATSLNGTPEERFTESLRILNETLQNLRISGTERIVISEVQKAINPSNETKIRRLRLEYKAGFYFAEMVYSFLFSGQIQSELFKSDDPYFDDSNSYSLQTGEFHIKKVKSTIALLLDRISLSPDAFENTTEEYRSAWLLLCASSSL